jgi:ArsR family transcriptional regulator
MNYRQAKIRADIMKALANPVRVLVIHALQQGEKCVSDLNKMVKLNQSNMSRHLTVLKKAGILSDRRDGMRVYYRLQLPGILNAFECTSDVVKSVARQHQENERAL